ncbi:stage II sporulation protein M [Candidatus Pacearchaeota archaeon]|nr:stage II sporulation protein M [Candidatus Pacearchaeota archaeon]
MAKKQKKLMKMKEKEDSSSYMQCWNYLKESKFYIYIIISLFALSILIGFIFPVFFIEAIKSLLKELAEKTQDMNFMQMFIFIFKNNLTTAFSGMIIGLFLGIFPVIITIINGYVLGFVSSKTADSIGAKFIFALLPHGIFEIPALIISLSLGLRLGMFIFAKEKSKSLKYNLENSLRVFILIILPLLFIAGIIETLLIFLIK